MPREIDSMQEKLVIQEFLRKDDLFEDAKVTYPDPPDCTYVKDNKKGWIEVTTVFRLWKNFTPNKEEEKIYGTYEYECPVNEDEYITWIVETIIKRIKDKESNPNYIKYKNELGLGTLIIYIDDASFHWQNHLEKIINRNHYKHLPLNMFKSVYIYNFPVAIYQTSSNPLCWQPKVLEGHKHFHLILELSPMKKFVQTVGYYIDMLRRLLCRST